LAVVGSEPAARTSSDPETLADDWASVASLVASLVVLASVGALASGVTVAESFPESLVPASSAVAGSLSHAMNPAAPKAIEETTSNVERFRM
jgi:hypothetical protein